MTTWWRVFERRKGSFSWTPTCVGSEGLGITFFASKNKAEEEVSRRRSAQWYSEKWENKIGKVEFPR